MKTILFHAREAGVASMMATLVKPLRNQGYNIVYDVADYAAGILKNNNAGSFEDADLVVCGYDTPELDRIGAFLVSVANSVPSLGLLDSWKGLNRFWHTDGHLRPLTDRLIVPDESVRRYLIARGVPSDWPVVAGHPGLERFRNIPAEERESLKRKVRDIHGLNSNDRVMLFLSEPLRLPGDRRLSLLDAKVKDGITVQKWLVDTYGTKFQLSARLHPIEAQTIPEGWIDAGNMEFDSALALADIVIGLGSTTLAYAVAYGLTVRCLDNEMLDWNPEHSEIPAELWDDLITTGIFQNDPVRLSSGQSLILQSPINSIERIIREVEKLIYSP